MNKTTEKREIKFRAWDKGNNEMHYKVNLYSLNSNGIINNVQLGNKDFMRHIGFHCELMQYTGHKIGETDIYEGDIIREEIEGDSGDERLYYVVTWIKEWSMFGCLHLRDEYEKYLDEGAEGLDETMFWTFPLADEKYGKRKVIGNIYQNSELLKSK